MSAPRTILVTGCAGFIGSHLCDRLLDEGETIVGLDNLITGKRRNLPDGTHLTFIEADVADKAALEGLAPDLVVNLACPASPAQYQADPLHTFRTSVLGTLNLAELALAHGARLVHASTSEVYGDPEVHPQTEDYRGSVNPIGPRACYDEGKRAAETVLFDYRRTLDLDIGVARIFNTYGPRMDPYDGRVVANFLRQALMGEPLTIYGDGRQTRSFCFVTDTVDALCRLARAPDGVTGPINIGNPEERTILELAELVRELVGDVAIAFEPLPQDDPAKRKPDISRAGEMLDWAPRVPLREGLTRTLDYFDNLISSGAVADYGPRGRGRVPARS